MAKIGPKHGKKWDAPNPFWDGKWDIFGSRWARFGQFACALIFALWIPKWPNLGPKFVTTVPGSWTLRDGTRGIFGLFLACFGPWAVRAEIVPFGPAEAQCGQKTHTPGRNRTPKMIF